MIFGQKPCFLGPRQLARQKVNIDYTTYYSLESVINQDLSGLSNYDRCFRFVWS